MRKNIIKLKFATDISSLAGNDYGYLTYLDQIKDNLNWDGKNVIVFPNHIDRVSIGFVQGLFREILKRTDKSDIERLIKIKTNKILLNKKIMNDIKF